MIDSLRKCSGITDPFYQSVSCNQTYCFLATKMTNGKQLTTSAIRSKRCEGSVQEATSTLCNECSSVVPILQQKCIEKKPVHPNTPLATLSRSHLITEVKEGRSRFKKIQGELQRMRLDVARNGVHLSGGVSAGLAATMDEHPIDNELINLFWKEQSKAFSTNPHGMRWHPMIIRFAIYLQYQSPRAYQALRDTGVLRLPNKSTLRDYTNVIQPKAGFQAHVFEVHS